ncbi:AdeC/AdeK/OprM family multidrug efflux complex outer membrane factor [Pseudomonas sp. TTU2014-080ASC]|uniref:AdeC/AdeK/OprM family multidrug efflux complex outer membrane factor n=1 Tax=Pseudomonas sp. TTU2014-080ASC TaxID=1729724 RepID=UPI000718599D|nr:AdeC/AdeK/OprM family multidrug efflux complex outer membrane factor [Pseudomonas sp. TTU2014-080ASC]KRW62652.1 multidrug transporter [Pseudomonas sp. TTU2014-080ASC]
MKRSVLPLALAVSLLSGCSLIPDYERPQAPVAQAWPEGPAAQAAASGSSAAEVLEWNSFFRDPALRQLMQVALDNNRDLRVASLNVDAYRALYRIQRSELFPSVGINGSGTRQRTPGDLNGTGEPQISGQYGVTAGVNAWEVDFFGRLRSLSEQALQQYFATEQAARSAQISLVSSVAAAYLQWQADQTLLKVTQDTLKTFEDSYALTQRSFDVGVADALALSQARTAVDSARVSLTQYQRLVELDRNALVQLIGAELPADLPQGLDLDSEVLSAVPAGLPSDLLQRRPDLLGAEFQLKAANANIGAARAAFFPSITLTGNAGTSSSELSGLFDAGSGSWLFQPQINLPIFNAGRLRANLEYAKLQEQIQVAQYEKAVQVAFREVSDSLASRTIYEQQLKAQRELLNASETYYNLADRRYQAGVDSYLTLLDAQRQLFSARQALVTSRLAQLSSEVELYKALGGGWSDKGQPPQE